MMFAKPLEFHCFNYYVCKRKKKLCTSNVILVQNNSWGLGKK